VVQTNKLLRICAGTCLAGWLAFPPSAKADQVVLTPVADATLIERAPGSSVGGAEFFNAGTTQAGTRNRALIQFDPLSQIPANATITSATLTLQVVRVPLDGFAASAFGIYRVLRPWGEGTNLPVDNSGGLGGPAMPGDATWISRFYGTGQDWAAPGGAPEIDFSANLSSAAVIYGVDESPYEFASTSGTVADMQLWLNHPESNFGWMLISQSEDTPFTARRFNSSEEPSGNVPTLIVDFEVVPEPRTIILCGVGLIGLAGVRRWKRNRDSNIAAISP
jgi:hypothetical protein